MVKVAVILIFSMFFMVGCNRMNDYKYVEVIAEQTILSGTVKKDMDPKVIKANSDSAAYLEAFEMFCTSLKASKDIKESMGTILSYPISFKLLNDMGEDITKSIFFIDKLKKEQEIESMVFSIQNPLEELTGINKGSQLDASGFNNSVDSAKLKQLIKQFRVKTDEFSNNNRKWYEHKTAPRYINRNGIYCYFDTENEIPGFLRFKVQYYSDDWLFFEAIQFSIDGVSYDYIPSKTETDNGEGGKIWEWFDERVTDSDEKLINALANAKNAKMKFIGKQYYDIKTISAEQIRGIKQTVELYNVLGGKF